ncbi:MAG TPA: hypothetical protein VII66_07375 [Gemmatimonadaceae bacterium]
MRVRNFRSLAVVVALAALAACTDNTSPVTQLSGGSYSLQTVNGTNVPYTYTSGSTTITIQSDIYTLNNDGTYSESISEIISNGFSSSPASDGESGTWSQNGNAVVFAPSYSTQNNYSQYTGALSGSSTFSHSTLTFSYSGVVWVYAHT